MSDLSAVVGYLADVAASDAKESFFVDGVVFTGIKPIEFGNSSPLRKLERLAAIDLLHRDENLVWVGRLWIVGEIEGVNYRWPIERMRVSLGQKKGFLRDGLPMPRSIGGWTLPAGILHPPALTEVALQESWGGPSLIGFMTRSQLPPERIAEMRTATERFVGRYLSDAGLPDLSITAPGDHPTGEYVEPTVLATEGYYLDRHPFELNRSSVLKLWRGKALERSVLAAFYGDDEARPYRIDQPGEQPVQSPLPLNARQRQAVITSRGTPLTVVSGPPGTGKSHLVAAAAIDQVAAGRSVLVATQSLHASDVVADLVDRYPMVEALRFGDDGSVRRLSDKLSAGIPAPDERYDLGALDRRCDELNDEIARHRSRLARRITELGAFESALIRRHDIPLWLAPRDLEAIDAASLRRAVADRDAQGWSAWWKRRSAHKTLRDALGVERELSAAEILEITEAVEADQLVSSIAGRDLGLDDLWVELDRLEEQWRATIGDLLEAKRRDTAQSKNREALNQLASALRLGPLARREALLSVGSEFLQVVPLWIGTLGEIEAVLPVEPGLFDMVILDEASQISQLSAVPALARARRAVVVGDSRQLRHVSFVSDAVQADAAAEHELSPALRSRLNDRTNSAFDAATAVAPVIELDEHFRSAPHIIGFSDREFYDGKLRLMTQHPRNEARDAIEVIEVDGARGEDRVVQAEVDEVIAQVRNKMSEGQYSIGVVSPFRAQADALEEAILSGFRLEEIDRHRLRVGTVHSFQGTERDHMIISIGAGRGDRRALRFAEDPAVFNVMVTRARSHIVVVTCLDRKSAGTGLLGKYLRHADEPPSPRHAQVHASGWTERVASELERHTSQRVITDYEVAGDTIDVVVGSGTNAFGIETEVHPAGPARHIERRLALRRAGWDITSLHRSSCFGREEEAIAGLLARVASW